MRDSAGIRVVESVAPAWPDSTAGWRLSPTLLLDVGGAAETAFPLALVTDAARLSDGRVVVAHGGAGTLEFFGEDGAHLATVGRRGEGPGEFPGGHIPLERMPGDSLLAGSPSFRSRQVFDPDGRYIRRLEGTATSIQVQGTTERTADQMWLPDARHLGMHFGATGQVDANGQAQDTLILVAPAGQGATAEVRFPSRVRQRTAGGELEAPHPSVFAVAMATLDRLYLSNTADPDLHVYRIERGTAGVPSALVPEAIFRRAWTPTPIDEALRQRLRTDYATLWGTDTTAANAWRFQQFDSRPLAATLPAHHDFRVDAAGNVWMPRYTPGLATIYWPTDVSSTWDVYAADGRWLGGVPMPARFWPFEIGPDWVLGVWRDEFDAEHVRIYAILKD